ncbi:MAG: helix-turn-helix transcriptional regulator [Rhodoluna sp.]|nr:helix-turn-helix transcriptional regulator [Rhodoluna sp.]
MAIYVDFDELRNAKGLTVAELAYRVGITQANLFVLKNNRGKAIRFTTLEGLCKVLECQPGDILKFSPDTLPNEI